PQNARRHPPTTGTTTDADAGRVVTVVVTGSDGQTQTVTATVKADGTYSVDVPNALPDGSYTAEASVKDPAGNEAVAKDDGSVDTAAASTVDAPALINDNTPPTTSPTTDAAEGQAVTVVVTDSQGNTQTVTT
ncbi:hypothetical protein BWD09_13560, partial [Neisseria dentiae]